jgi:hypothetical protein
MIYKLDPLPHLRRSRSRLLLAAHRPRGHRERTQCRYHEYLRSMDNKVGQVASLLLPDVSGDFENVSHARLLHGLRERRVDDVSIYAYSGEARFITDYVTGGYILALYDRLIN